MATTISDSIAIKLLNENIILTGIGNELHLHNSYKNEAQLLPFTLRGKVHGIQSGTNKNSGQILIIGEKEFILARIYNEENFKLLYRGFLSDWISCVRFLEEHNQFVLISAHSTALRLAYDELANVSMIVEKSSCADKSTLYCSYAYGINWKDLVIFGGNAFGELLVWKPSCQVDKENRVPLLHRIVAHNGVIFSIHLDNNARLLTTTSDDRSIRFWDISRAHNSGKSSVEDWENTTFVPLASGYGHVARVFQGKIIESDRETFAVTAGEDSYICVWNTTGQLLFKRRQQFGATIWNFEYDQCTKTLFTVGSTGSLVAYCLQDVLCNSSKNSLLLLPAASTLKLTEYIAKIKFVRNELLVGVTNLNRMVSRKANLIDTDWQLVDEFVGYKCTVLEVYDNLIALAGYKRVTLFSYHETSDRFEKHFDGELLHCIIRSFRFLSTDEYLISDESGECILARQRNMKSRQNIELPLCKERWLTAALKIDHFLVLSNRQGNLLLYVIDKNENFVLSSTLKHVHGHLGATVLILEKSNDQMIIIKSAGHDGSIQKLRVNKQTQTLAYLSRELVPIAWVEGLHRLNDIEFVLGFNDNHFVVWSREADFALQLPCGGGHRCWDYQIPSAEHGKEKISTLFIKNKQVLFQKYKLFNTTAFPLPVSGRKNWHVKPCNNLKLIEHTTSKDVIVISAGDDNLIKISSYCPNTKKLLQLNEIHSHISNVRALKVLHLRGPQYVIFSAGGRAQICITEFNVETNMIEEKLNFNLKSATNTTTKKSKNYRCDPETRIMSIDVQMNELNRFVIFLGCSDGFVRKFILSENLQLSLSAEVFYEKCILHVSLVDKAYLLVAATDGVIRFSNLALETVLLEIQHHESGINGFDAICDSKGSLHLLTGGDDQTVTYSKIALGSAKTFPKVLETKHLNHLHTAQVTAVKISPCLQFFYTSGVDQNLIKTNLLTWKSEEEFHSCIADVKGLSLNRNATICFLYGCGIQIFLLKS